jgi:hypothetical protein
MWRKSLLVATGLLISCSTVGSSQATTDSPVEFERLKRLVGSWTVIQKGSSRPAFVATYRMAAGDVLVEDNGGALSVYHMDSGKLMVTHYCATGNQPRMRLEAADDRHVGFAMFDITNHANPQAYHSTHLDVVFLSEDRVDLAYRGSSGGRETTQVFQLTRKKS